MLLMAATQGNEEMVAHYLMQSPELIQAVDDCTQRTALHCAAKNGHDKVAAQLLAQCPTLINNVDWTEETALHLAAEYGHDKVVALLLSHSPKSIEAKDKFCRTALHYAALGGHDKVVVHLLSLVNETDHDSRTALHYAAEHGKENVITLLLAHRPQLLGCTDSRRRTALHEAVIGGHDKAVEQLLQGPSPRWILDLVDDHKWTSTPTALFLQLSSQEPTKKKPVLLVDVQDSTKKTAFHYAALQNNEKVMPHLLAQMPSQLHRGDLVGRTALHYAAVQGQVNMVTRLLTHDFTLFSRMDMDGRNALQYAVVHGQERVVDAILAHTKFTSFAVELVDKPRNTLLHLALLDPHCSRESLVEKIWRANPAAVLEQNTYGETPLHVACTTSNEWAIEFLQLKMSIDEVLCVYAGSWENISPFLDEQCEPLLARLHQDVVELVFEFLGTKYGIRRKNKRLRPVEEAEHLSEDEVIDEL